MLSAVIRNGHSYRAVPLAGQLVHHRSAHPGPLVLGATPLNSPARTLDRDRTVSQRSEPSSRTALMGEQPNPWEVLPPQDATSRHRGAKPRRRCERLGVISLLSPGSFYPMIPDSSTRDQKVTKPDFRPCSACMPHSQAPLCLCTLRL